MSTPIYDRYSYNWTGRGRNSVNTTERQQEAMPTRPQSLQLPTPVPSTSRWSRTTYSLSVYEEDRFGEDGTTLREVTPVARSVHASTADSAMTRRTIMFSRVPKVLGLVYLIIACGAVIIIFAKTFANREPGNPLPSSTSTHKTTTSTLANQQQGADHSPTTSDQSSTAAVVQVATQVIRTTVGTLTESAVSGATAT